MLIYIQQRKVVLHKNNCESQNGIYLGHKKTFSYHKE